ncbi:MAG: sensor histidine kinase [Pseudonocardia sp.]
MSPARAPRLPRLRRLRAWWARRSLRARITVVIGGVAVLALLALARVATGLIAYAVTNAADTQLRAVAQSAAAEVGAERAVAPGAGQPRVRVLDTAGQPVDGGPAVPLRPNDLRRLSGGDAITEFGADEARRLLAVPAATPDGVPRLVLASSELVGYYTVLRHGGLGLALFALLAAAAVTLAAWITAGLALRPVDRMRASAAALPPGERLPVPPAHDELGALAGELNALLARRDDAVSRLERFTGDAAHELRSPVASIRAQAEVAVVHPDPALAQETLRSVAEEAARLSELLSDLLALARADAGRRPPAEPVDLVAAAQDALSRRTAATNGAVAAGPVLRLVAPVPATIAAAPREVALVLDNLLDNAARHASTVVRVSVLPAGRDVRLVVDDDGPGVPEGDRERVFDRFTRLEPAADGGAGLGLALVAALVRGRGGAASLGSAPEGGVRVEVRWPAAE